MTPPDKATVPPPEDEPDSEGASDQGQAEGLSLGRGLPVRDLRKEADESEHNRAELFKGHFEKISLCFLWLLSIALLVIGVVWLYHLIAPHCWHWLDHEQLDTLKDLLTGGLVVGILTDHFRKRLS